MIERTTVTITTDASGDATVYLGTRLRGRVHAIKYTPGTLATGADLAITGEDTGVPILTQSNAGTSALWKYPRALANKHTDGSAATDAFADVHVFKERIKVVVAQGGNVGVGSIDVFIDTPQPY